jgi:hypothetical protein
MARPTKTGLPVTAHINPELHRRLVADAKKAFRSLSSEIEMRLFASYEQQDAAAAEQVRLVKEVAETTANAITERLAARPAGAKKARDRLERALREGKVKNPKQAAMLKAGLATLNESAEDTEDSDAQSAATSAAYASPMALAASRRDVK